LFITLIRLISLDFQNCEVNEGEAKGNVNHDDDDDADENRGGGGARG